MGLVNNSYRYTKQLLELEGGSPCILDAPVSGFLPLSEWDPYLQSHPDQRLAAYLRPGIRYGFRIGFSPSQELQCCKTNLPSVRLNRQVVDNYIHDEAASGKLKAVAMAQELPQIHLSPIGVIPKPNQPGKFRLICDLSSPHSQSVNDGIAPELCSLQYASVDQAVALASRLGRGSLMAKLDLKSAYRMIPVHLEDQQLLGLEWGGTTYCDQALPFGLRSAPLIFTAVADGLAWAFSCNGIQNTIHYLDDFFFVGPPASDECAAALRTAIPLCHRLGLPVAPAKVEGPDTTLVFLGIEIDSTRQEIRLPQTKLLRIQTTLREWAGRSNPTRRQLQSLIGLLSHAATVVRPGRTFLRGLIELVRIAERGSQHIWLTAQCRADIQWFLAEWNGTSFFPSGYSAPRTVVLSDASGSWGAGAVRMDSHEWFQVKWPHTWSATNIAVKELFPIVLCAAIWGSDWSGLRVHFRCDNWSVVQALTARRARDQFLMHLLRCLFFLEAHFRFDHSVSHIPGRENSAADALSRDKVIDFFSLLPQAPRMPSPVPQALCELLADQSITWTSQRWRDLFRDSLRTALQRAPRGPTCRPGSATYTSVLNTT